VGLANKINIYKMYSTHIGNNNYQLKSLDSVINRFFMKMFRTSNMLVVSDCQEQFKNFVLPSVQLARRAEKFVNKLRVDQVYLSLFFLCFLCATSFW